MVGIIGVFLCFSGILSAQEVPVVSNASPSDARQAGTNAAVDVWNKFSSAVELPGSHSLTTNASGVLVHHFNMQPVVTNMTALTNDLPQLEQKQAALEQEMKTLPQRESILRASWIQDCKIMANIVTNFVPADAEGKKIKERMDEIEKELKHLRVEFKKRLDADPEFQKAKAKMDEDAAAVKAVQDRKSKLREERGALLSQIGIINELKKRELNKQALKVEPKVVVP